MKLDQVKDALEKGGSIRAAAKHLGVSPNSLQWWLARNGYRVRITRIAQLEQVTHQVELSDQMMEESR